MLPVCVCEIGRGPRLEGGAAAGFPEHRGGVRRHRHVAVVCFREHVHRWNQTQRRHHRSFVLDFLHFNLDSVDQVCPDRLTCQRQWRWYTIQIFVFSDCKS